MGELVTLIHSIDRGRKWNVEFDDELIVENSKDPECDTARARLARGITGKVGVIDADPQTAETSPVGIPVPKDLNLVVFDGGGGEG